MQCEVMLGGRAGQSLEVKVKGCRQAYAMICTRIKRNSTQCRQESGKGEKSAREEGREGLGRWRK